MRDRDEDEKIKHVQTSDTVGGKYQTSSLDCTETGRTASLGEHSSSIDWVGALYAQYDRHRHTSASKDT